MGRAEYPAAQPFLRRPAARARLCAGGHRSARPHARQHHGQYRGTAFWGTSAEVQTSIPYLPSDFALKFAVFADQGSVWGSQGPALSQNFATGSAGTVRSSFGAGLIWGSPFGPIRVDYAMPVTQASFDKTQRLSFSAGGF